MSNETDGVAIAIVSIVINSGNDICGEKPVNLRAEKSILPILLK